MEFEPQISFKLPSFLQVASAMNIQEEELQRLLSFLLGDRGLENIWHRYFFGFFWMLDVVTVETWKPIPLFKGNSSSPQLFFGFHVSFRGMIKFSVQRQGFQLFRGRFHPAATFQVLRWREEGKSFHGTSAPAMSVLYSLKSLKTPSFLWRYLDAVFWAQGSGDDQLHETTPLEVWDFETAMSLGIFEAKCWTGGAWLPCLPSMQEDCSHLVDCLPQT